MSRSLKVLVVGGSDHDVDQLRRDLERSGIDLLMTSADSPQGFTTAVVSDIWDCVIAFSAIDGFGALDASALLRDARCGLPLIVTRAAGEAFETVKTVLFSDESFELSDDVRPLAEALISLPHNVRRTCGLSRSELSRKVRLEIMRAGIGSRRLSEYLPKVHSAIRQVIDSENCSILLRDPLTGRTDFEYWADSRESQPPPDSEVRGLADHVLLSGEPLIVNKEVRTAAGELTEIVRKAEPWAAWIGVPLSTSARPCGVLALHQYDEDAVFTGQDLHFLSLVADQISIAIERQRSEQALIASEERYRDMVENAIDILYVHDLQGNFISVNAAAERITGYSRSEILRMNMAQVVAPEFLDRTREMLAEKLGGTSVTAYDVEIQTKDGRRATLEISSRLMYANGSPAGVQGIARDITEKKHLEDRYRQSQKLEAIGLLAGGISHDFNNLLMAITGYSEITLAKMSPDDPLRPSIEGIRDTGERASALTQRLLAFSRKQVLKPVVHDLNSVILSMDKLLCRVLREDIEFRMELDTGLQNINADPGQIEQVIINLAINAQDAMPSGGRLTIKTENIHDGSARAEPGAFVRMTITDSGDGIDEQIIDRIFEPFFTTKGFGKGSGLGLATVHGIVTQSGGEISVHSVKGQGTEFEIVLPAADTLPEFQEWPSKKFEELSGTETVLIVEDDASVRRLVGDVLVHKGYSVLEASNGEEAIAICDRHSGTIDLLLTDLVMPRMSGIELTGRVADLHPETRPLVMTGYAGSMEFAEMIPNFRAAYIEKPFTPEMLARKVREVLESAAPVAPTLEREGQESGDSSIHTN
ncbi:MAG: PAS domain S-box protein [Acidobacteria bacterium]|nr:PAS domain S-box protein [Acidobacteriota bacterium]